MFCNKCGNEIKNTDRFCNKCGNPVAGSQQVGFAPNVSQKKKNNAALAIILAVLVGILILLAVIVFGKNDKPTSFDAEFTAYTEFVFDTESETEQTLEIESYNESSSTDSTPVFIKTYIIVKGRGALINLDEGVYHVRILENDKLISHYKATVSHESTNKHVCTSGETISTEEKDVISDLAVRYYADVINEYKNILKSGDYKNENSQYAFVENNNLKYVNPNLLYIIKSTNNGVQYAVRDLNKDGIPELFIGTNRDKYDLFTYSDGEIYTLISREDSMRGAWGTADNGVVFKPGGTPTMVSYTFFAISSNCSFLEKIDSVSCSTENVSAVYQKYDHDSGKLVNIKKEEYYEILKTHIGSENIDCNADKDKYHWKEIEISEKQTEGTEPSSEYGTPIQNALFLNQDIQKVYDIYGKPLGSGHLSGGIVYSFEDAEISFATPAYENFVSAVFAQGDKRLYKDLYASMSYNELKKIVPDIERPVPNDIGASEIAHDYVTYFTYDSYLFYYYWDGVPSEDAPSAMALIYKK